MYELIVLFVITDVTKRTLMVSLEEMMEYGSTSCTIASFNTLAFKDPILKPPRIACVCVCVREYVLVCVCEYDVLTVLRMHLLCIQM